MPNHRPITMLLQPDLATSVAEFCDGSDASRQKNRRCELPYAFWLALARLAIKRKQAVNRQLNFFLKKKLLIRQKLCREKRITST